LLPPLSAPPPTPTQLAGDLPISRQAVVKHLSALADAGLLERERRGREVRYRMTPEPLSDAVGWMAEVGGQWDQRLAGLARTFASGEAQRGEMPR
jgi:ArsR family transcriptional regulator, cadmium/lead-responsive transcriptional repressor